jgi:hypothetical protein
MTKAIYPVILTLASAAGLVACSPTTTTRAMAVEAAGDTDT